MKQFAMKSSQDILMNGFFPQQNSKMKDETIDIFLRKNLNRSKIWAKWSLQDQSAMKHLVSCILITCNSENSAPKFPQNNNINTELKPHDNDNVAA